MCAKRVCFCMCRYAHRMAGTHGRRVQLVVVRAALGTQQVRAPALRCEIAREVAVRAMVGGVGW